MKNTLIYSSYFGHPARERLIKAPVRKYPRKRVFKHRPDPSLVRICKLVNRFEPICRIDRLHPKVQDRLVQFLTNKWYR